MQKAKVKQTEGHIPSAPPQEPKKDDAKTVSVGASPEQKGSVTEKHTPTVAPKEPVSAANKDDAKAVNDGDNLQSKHKG